MSFVQKLYGLFSQRMIKDTNVIPDVNRWKEIIKSQPMPKDGIDVAYNKHKCKMSYFPKASKLCMNLFSLGALVLALPYIIRPKKLLSPANNNRLLLVRDRRIRPDDIFPQDLHTRFEAIDEIEQKDPSVGILCKQASQLFWKCVRRHPFSFWLNFLILKELSIHSRYLLNNDVKAAAMYAIESNVAFPVVTQLYEETGRSLICFMHGEYIWQMIHAYMKFTEYYVWDELYEDIFKNELNCQVGKYILYTPKKLTKKWDLENVNPEHFCTYYFSGESSESIRKIAGIFSEFQAKGLTCKVRPHPRFVVHVKEIFESFEGIEIEMPKEVSLQESLSKAEYVVGLASTVLSEASIEGRKIVVDDISNVEQYQSLKQRRAMVLSRKHILLSELRDREL